MSRVISREATARKPYQCGRQAHGTCQRLISIGDRYESQSIPPDTDENYGDHWLTYRVCLPCRDGDRQSAIDSIRGRYGIEVRIGGLVRFDGQDGTVVEFESGRVVVRTSDGRKHHCHPMWRMEYLPAPDPEVAARGRGGKEE